MFTDRVETGPHFVPGFTHVGAAQYQDAPKELMVDVRVLEDVGSIVARWGGMRMDICIYMYIDMRILCAWAYIHMRKI